VLQFARGSLCARVVPLLLLTTLVIGFLLLLLLSPIARLSAAPPAVTAPDRIVSLREAAAPHRVRVGITYQHGSDDPLYTNTVLIGFDSITPENSMKFEYIHPCPPTWLIDDNQSVRDWVYLHRHHYLGHA
jgi:hypothetical protein